MDKMVPAYEGKENYLFVSYAHKDSERVLPVIETLYRKKIRIWYDEGIAPGSEWPKNIEDHLNGAAAVIVFVSEASLRSPNCENEVVRSTDGGRKVYTVSLDGSVHPKLPDTSESIEAVPVEMLERRIPVSFIGDGVSGYERKIATVKRANLWNILIIAAVLLFAVLGAGLYGLNKGVFDAYLPGLRESALKIEKYTIEETGETVEISGDQNLNGILADAAGREDLNQKIEFQSDKSRECLSEAIGFDDWGTGDMTYLNLANNPCEELNLNDPDEEVLGYMAYFPDLKCIRIRDGSFETLEPLLSCQTLETVYVTYEAFPFEIPENAQFEVEYIK